MSTVNGLTPVQEIDGMYLKREDMWHRGEAHGSKCKVGFRLAGEAPTALVGGSHRTSPQAERIALIAHELGVPAHVHTAAAAETTDVIRRCEDLGAQIHEHRPGYMNVVLARAREQAEAEDLTLIPWGMESPIYIEEVRKQVRNLPSSCGRIVAPLGSGMALAGILWGLDDLGWNRKPVIAVSVGSDSYGKRMDKFAPPNWRDRVQIERSPHPFDRMIQGRVGPVDLDPQYEAKILDYVREGDLLWLVAHRDHPRLRA